MKSGKKKERKSIEVRLNLNEYRNAHSSRSCDGVFEVGFVVNGFHTSSALGPIQVPCIPLVSCRKCGASFVAPKFEEWLDDIISEHLIRSKEMLSKKQIKFLRQHFGFTQDELAERLQLKEGKSGLSKMESESSDRAMTRETQILLKVFLARLIGVDDIESIYKIHDIDPTRMAEIDLKILPTASEIKKAFRVS